MLLARKKIIFKTAEKRTTAPVTDLFPMLPPIELKEVLLAKCRFPLPETLLLLRVAGLLIDPLITSFFHFNSFLGEIWNCLHPPHSAQCTPSPGKDEKSNMKLFYIMTKVTLPFSVNETSGHPTLHFVKWIIEGPRVNGPLIGSERLLSSHHRLVAQLVAQFRLSRFWLSHCYQPLLGRRVKQHPVSSLLEEAFVRTCFTNERFKFHGQKA